MNAVFLDTVGLIALWDKVDQWHEAPQLAYDKIKHARTPVLTTTYVLLECGNAAARRPFRPALTQWRTAMVADNAVVDPNLDDQTEAWAAFDRGDAGNAGIVDHI